MRVLRKREVADRLGVSIMTLWRWEKSNYFPKRVQLGSASVGYLEEEVNAWLQTKAAERCDAA
jgi:prophage regulatory protein